ncbi:hypothetical protein X975_19810, partial [Stegodyphus mimosarum]
MLSVGDRSVGQVSNQIPYVLSKVRTQREHVVLQYLVKRWNLAGIEDRAQPLDVKCQNCTNLHSYYRQSELEICMSCTSGCANQVQGPYTDIKCKQVTCSLNTCSHQNNKELGRIWKDEVVPLLYPALLLGAPESPSLSMLHCNGHHVHATANVNKPNEQILCKPIS